MHFVPLWCAGDSLQLGASIRSRRDAVCKFGVLRRFLVSDDWFLVRSSHSIFIYSQAAFLFVLAPFAEFAFMWFFHSSVFVVFRVLYSLRRRFSAI